MPRQLHLRELTETQKREIARLANSRTEPVRRVQRAKIIQLLVEDPQLPASMAGRLARYRSDLPGWQWVKRFKARGLAGLEDAPRAGHPRLHDETVRGALIGLALQRPDTRGDPFKPWTLERLQAAFQQHHRVHLSDSTIWTGLDDEGLQWKRQQSWFHDADKHDPAFVEKRGA